MHKENRQEDNPNKSLLTEFHVQCPAQSTSERESKPTVPSPQAITPLNQLANQLSNKISSQVTQMPVTSSVRKEDRGSAASVLATAALPPTLCDEETRQVIHALSVTALPLEIGIEGTPEEVCNALSRQAQAVLNRSKQRPLDCSVRRHKSSSKRTEFS